MFKILVFLTPKVTIINSLKIIILLVRSIRLAFGLILLTYRITIYIDLKLDFIIINLNNIYKL